MFWQVFIECRRGLHHEESYVKYFQENSSFESSDRRCSTKSFRCHASEGKCHHTDLDAACWVHSHRPNQRIRCPMAVGPTGRSKIAWVTAPRVAEPTIQP